MMDWSKTFQGIAAIIAVIFATTVAGWKLGLPRLVFSPEAPIHARIEALEHLNRDCRLRVSDQAWWRANPLGILWPEMDAFVAGGAASHGAAAGDLHRCAVAWGAAKT